jgi:hypothetical protein
LIAFRTRTNYPSHQFFAYELNEEFLIRGADFREFLLGEERLHREPRPAADLETWCRAYYPAAVDFQATDLDAGDFYPRIWRGIWSPLSELATPAVVTNACVSAGLLADRLFEIFRIVSPADSNATAFGHEIRDVLASACMEVEAHLAAVLRANNYQANPTPSMNDYVRLRDPMWLSNFRVALRAYPGMASSAPYESWNATQPAQSLPWWIAYTRVKHDKEAYFADATLRHAIDAVCAVIVLLQAQFGLQALEHHEASALTRRFALSYTKVPAANRWYCSRPRNDWTARLLF